MSLANGKNIGKSFYKYLLTVIAYSICAKRCKNIQEAAQEKLSINCT